jgi:gamma-glutamylputrescine oxidase
MACLAAHHRPADLTPRHSYYAATAARAAGIRRCKGDAGCDVAIVGGGLAGLSAALELAERGCSVVLLEAREVGWGASGRNGGQAIHGLACDQDVIEAARPGRRAAGLGTCRSRRWT